MAGQQPAPGWYPDPSGAGGQKYWDGQRWIDSAATAGGTSKGSSSKTVFIVLGVIAAVLLAVLIGVTGGEDSSSSSSSPTTTQVFIPKPPTTREVVPLPARPASADCVPASQDLIDQVDAHLDPTGQHLVDAFVVTSPEGYQYVGGNIYEGQDKNSSADVWIAREDWVVYALSGSAREATPQLADGRNLGLSAGDEYGEAVMTCTIQSERARNRGGN